MSPDNWARLWDDASSDLPPVEERMAGIEIGDEVQVIFDATQTRLGQWGVVTNLGTQGAGYYPFLVRFTEEPPSRGTSWVTWVIKRVAVPELTTTEDADRFLDSISKER